MMARRDVYNRRMRDQRRMLTAVARGAVPADRYVRGGTLLNVYTGELYPANVAIRGARIAYVGTRDDMVGPTTDVLDAGGHVLVPGYITLRAALVARGYPHHEPLFSLFFRAADFLPAVRLTPRGVWDVKRGRVLLPSRRRTAARRASRRPWSP
jgi:adenine deaminase